MFNYLKQTQNKKSVTKSIPVLPAPSAFTDKFSFTLTSEKITSAGIYTTGGTKVRELWAALSFPAGTHVELWDGKDDFGNTLPADTYVPKVLTHNIQYEWAGVWANTSLNQTGDDMHKPLDPILAIRTMIHPNGKPMALYASGYGEGGAAQGAFYLDNPQVRFTPMSIHGTNQNTDFLATNSTKIFYAGSDPLDSGSESFVYATNKSGNTFSTFSSGVTAKMEWGIEYQSVIGWKKEPASQSFTYNGSMTYTVSDSKPIRYNGISITASTGYNQNLNLSNVSKTGSTFSIPSNYNDIPSGATIIVNYARITDISGIAANDDYVFLSRKQWGNISVLNATTGALVQDLAIDKPSSVCVIGTDLWYAVSGTTVVRRPINTNGSLATATLTLTGFQSVLDINHNGNGLVAIIDGGSSQQIKAFSATTGAALWTRGQLGGLHAPNKEVFNDKFLFNKPTSNGDGLTTEFASIAFEPDGSYWVCDAGNTRIQHFAADGTYINNIQYLVRNYYVKVNKNQPHRVLSSFQEYEIDPTKPIREGWKLKYNWQENGTGNYNGLGDFATLSNGRTYGTQRRNAAGYPVVDVVEFIPATGVRVTNSTVPFGGYKMYDDGSIRWIVNSGGTQTWWRKNITGFDSNNDPIWGSDIWVDSVTVPLAGPEAGAPFSVDHHETTANGALAVFQGGIDYKDAPNQYRLGGLKNGTFKWRGLRTVEANHRGDFPENGEFDWANYGRWKNFEGKVDNDPVAGYYSSRVMAYNEHIVTGHHGEFWRGGQLNKYVHYHQDGLLIGVFGEQRAGGDGRKAPAFQAGNALTPNLVYFTGDTSLNVIHGDESVHQGIHRIKINNTGSIQFLTGTPTNAAPRALAGTDLLAGLKAGDIITGNTNGWTIPAPYNFGEYEDKFIAKLGSQSTDRYRLAGTDIYFEFVAPASGRTLDVTRTLGTNLNLSNWSMKGQVIFPGNMNNDPVTDKAGHYIEVLDDAGLVIAQYYYRRNSGNFYREDYIANGQVYKSLDKEVYAEFLTSLQTQRFTSLEIKGSASGITFEYGDMGVMTVPKFNSSANWQNPTTLRIKFFTQGNPYGRNVGFYKLRFFNT
jgi:hypothetical protein